MRAREAPWFDRVDGGLPYTNRFLSALDDVLIDGYIHKFTLTIKHLKEQMLQTVLDAHVKLPHPNQDQ